MPRPLLTRLARWCLLASSLTAAELLAQAPGSTADAVAQAAPSSLWLAPVVGLLAVGGPLAWWRLRRLQRQAVRHTQALHASETRLRNLFDQAPVAIVETDFSRAATWLDALRRGGVTDLDAHLVADPAEVLAAFRQVRVVDANRAALRLAGVESVASYAAGLAGEPSAEQLATFVAQVKTLWAGGSEMTRELGYRGIDQQPGHSLMHWSAPRVDGRPDYGRVQVAFTDLSVLRAAEGKLQDVEDRWRLTVMGINAGIWEFDFANKETFVSKRWQEIIGYDKHERVDPDEDFWPRIHPDEVQEVQRKLQDYLAGRSPCYSAEFRMRCKDGNYKWIRSRGMALFDLEGKPIRMVGSHTDIDNRKRAEDLVRASEESYRVLFENSPVAVIEYDLLGLRAWFGRLQAEGVKDFDAYAESHPEVFEQMLNALVVVGANRETFRLVGATNKIQAMASLASIITPDVARARRELCWALWEGRTFLEGEMQINAIDGTPRRLFYRWWVPSFRGEPSYDLTQVVLVDVTGIKRTEEALATERERLAVTLRAMTEAVITTDVHGRVLFLNEAASELTGWTAAAAIGEAVEAVCVLRDAKSLQALLPLASAALLTPQVVDLPAQTALFNRQGAHRLVEGRCAPIQGPDGQAKGAVLVLRDVTERARLEGEVLRASKLESVGVLAGGIAHDFNNLLTVVMGNITLAMLDVQVMAAAGRWLQNAEVGVMRARDLTQQLLTFARGGEPVRAAVNLAEVIEEAVHFSLHGSTVSSEFTVAADLWVADVDRGQVGQVIQNLVINAVQAMPNGGVIRVGMANQRLGPGSVAQLGAGDYLCITLSDTGVGIQPENLAHIFEPYFTTKKSGHGLGLAMVYSIIRRHGGHIEVESELGRGTCFRFCLPAIHERVAPVDELAVTPPRSASGRILFMDDEAPIRQLVEVLLQRLGFKVVLSADGEEAIALYRAALAGPEPFDLVIMDLTVPGGMGGREAMLELRRLDPGVKGLVSSGYSSDPVLANFRVHGFSGMVSKPYRLTDLAKAVRAVLEAPTV